MTYTKELELLEDLLNNATSKLPNSIITTYTALLGFIKDLDEDNARVFLGENIVKDKKTYGIKNVGDIGYIKAFYDGYKNEKSKIRREMLRTDEGIGTLCTLELFHILIGIAIYSEYNK